MKKDGYFTPNRYICELVCISRTWNADGELIDVEEKWEDGGKVHSDTMLLQQHYRRGNDRWRLIERVEHEQRTKTGVAPLENLQPIEDVIKEVVEAVEEAIKQVSQIGGPTNEI